ncbi:MAG: bifunctional UDP-N-acetylglucosamine diphosphorylase/glucosamine-1-phosphate N-acetyltransferase GlmU [Halieaceae bacterium]|jgi:bifunctional UDP-N-acetylglucosamine pyrophosphorylase / glucosamine-1-phosphate N-acetyltransferase|nr:bifunctional UDP-N-acetylglucosamine diphosphorylase/glucosamine-1-phosphate N-acetyltransferase GlmU [Halieaceae bacterium]
MSLEVIILAAGQGSRMKSRLPKVLHPVAGKPLLEHVVATAGSLNPVAIHVVVGHGAEKVKNALSDYTLHWTSQTQRLGTGHAVSQVLPELNPDSTVLILYGDVPMIAGKTLSKLIGSATSAPALLTAQVGDSSGYGRIIRDENGELVAVVEEKDADAAQRQITEINTGIMAAPAADLFELLPRVQNNNSQGEYYLPDILSLAVAEGKTVSTCEAESELEILGVNDRIQLQQIEREVQRLQVEQLMREGVTMADAARVDIRGSLTCAADVSIDINVLFEGEVRLGNNVTIGPNCVLSNVSVGNGVCINAMSHLEGAEIGDNCTIGPFARLRPGTVLREGARIGNFVETKKSDIGAGSKVNHLSYIGDCDMGANVNIGAGTITCNYDGANKFKTEIGDGVFVGSNSTLVAPLDVGNRGFIGAGSTITKTVAEDELAIGRARQRNIRGWQRSRKEHNKD